MTDVILAEGYCDITLQGPHAHILAVITNLAFRHPSLHLASAPRASAAHAVHKKRTI